MLGLWPRNEDGGRNDEVHAPEFLVPGDVLGRKSAGATGDDVVISSFFVGSQVAIGMGIEIGAIAAEREHQQSFGVQAWRANLSGGKLVEREFECVFEEHGGILMCLEHGGLFDQAAFGKSSQAEERGVDQIGFAVENQVAQNLAGGRRVHDAVAAEPVG